MTALLARLWGVFCHRSVFLLTQRSLLCLEEHFHRLQREPIHCVKGACYFNHPGRLSLVVLCVLGL